MFVIETIFSVVTLIAALGLTDRHPAAPVLGIVITACWAGMWFYTKQYGFLFLDIGIFLIYVHALNKQLKGEWR